MIMGATSGRYEGSAAIEGCKTLQNIDIFILHPHNRVSDVQRRQMTTVVGDTIHNLAVEGNFDDCQAMVKASFGDRSFLPADRSLVGGELDQLGTDHGPDRLLLYAAVALGARLARWRSPCPPATLATFFAGYLARQMGLPIARLIIATNRNDVLHRVMTTSTYGRQPLAHTPVPSMDITVSSNFERLLFDLYDRNGAALADLMRRFDSGDIIFSESAMAGAGAVQQPPGFRRANLCPDCQYLARVRIPARPAQCYRRRGGAGGRTAGGCPGSDTGHGTRQNFPGDQDRRAGPGRQPAPCT